MPKAIFHQHSCYQRCREASSQTDWTWYQLTQVRTLAEADWSLAEAVEAAAWCRCPDSWQYCRSLLTATYTTNHLIITNQDNLYFIMLPYRGQPIKTNHCYIVMLVVVVVVVVMTSPSGNCLYEGKKMSRRDEEFHQTLNPEGSVSPSW